MLRPIHTPLPAEDKIAGVLLHLERTPGATLLLTTLAVRRMSGVEALVILHLNDGGREHLTADEARLMASCLRDENGEAEGEAAHWASSLEDAAASAERQASAVRLAQGSDAGVRQVRAFGGR